jgi:hypothetical protein
VRRSLAAWGNAQDSIESKEASALKARFTFAPQRPD